MKIEAPETAIEASVGPSTWFVASRWNLVHVDETIPFEDKKATLRPIPNDVRWLRP
jgi:hypothetical protein